jgi:hypothetical protein
MLMERLRKLVLIVNELWKDRLSVTGCLKLCRAYNSSAHAMDVKS